MKPQYFVAAFIILSLVIVFAAVVIWKLSIAKRNRTKAQNFHIYNKRFTFYYDFVLTRKTFRKIFEQISRLSIYDFQDLRITSVKFYEAALKMSLILFVVGFIGFGDIIAAFVMLLYANVVLYTLVVKNINAVNREATKQLSTYLISLSQTYTRTRNIPDAIYDTPAPPLLRLPMDRIYAIVTANNGNELLTHFYQEIQNRSLRTLATTCYIRNDTGDSDSGEKSPFKQALTLIREDADSMKKLQLSQFLMFKILDVLPLVPLALYPVIRLIYEKMISGTISVFQGTLGYIIKLSILFSSFICYYVITTINNESVARTDDRLEFITKMLHSKKISKFAKSLIPHKFKTVMKKQRLINSCLSSKTLAYLYLEKFVFGMIAMITGIVCTFVILFVVRGVIYDSLAMPTMTLTLKYTAEQKYAMTEYDHMILDMDVCPDSETLYKGVRGILRGTSDTVLEAQVQRIQTKYKNYHNLRFRWQLAFLYIALYFIGGAMSDFLLQLRSKLVKSEAELDVLQLQTFIAILMDTSLDTMSVLYWLSKSSDIHKDALTFCFHEYSHDPVKAIKRLRSKSAIPEFTALCDTLLTTVHHVSLSEAFTDLVSARKSSLETRDMIQMDTLCTKRTFAGPIALIPTFVLLVMEFLVPIAVVAYHSALDTFSKLNM